MFDLYSSPNMMHILKVRANCASDSLSSCEGQTPSVCQGEHVYCIVLCHNPLPPCAVVIKMNKNWKSRYMWGAASDTIFKCKKCLYSRNSWADFSSEEWMKGMCSNGVGCSKRQSSMRDEEHSWHQSLSLMTEWNLQKKQFTVSTPEKIFSQLECEECPRDKRHCTGLAKRLASDLFDKGV